MPKLAFIIACEKVITEAETGVVSAIAMFTKLKASLPERPPENAVVPKEWALLTAWDPESGDEGKQFVQCIEMLFPDGKPFTENGRLPFKIEPIQRHFNTVKLLGFPIGQAGKCEVRMWLELEGKAISEKTSIFLLVEHQELTVPAAPKIASPA